MPAVIETFIADTVDEINRGIQSRGLEREDILQVLLRDTIKPCWQVWYYKKVQPEI